MLKNEKLQFDHGRIYKILDYIFQEYDRNFRKKFFYEEFEDQEALNEVLEELKEYRRTLKIKAKKTKKKTFLLSSLELRYLKTIYIEQNRHETSMRTNVFSIELSLVALCVTALTYSLPSNNWIVSIILFVFIWWTIRLLIHSNLNF